MTVVTEALALQERSVCLELHTGDMTGCSPKKKVLILSFTQSLLSYADGQPLVAQFSECPMQFHFDLG